MNVKSKKKRSFLQQAKKFGRQGQRGRGTNIAQDQYDYLVRVLERWKAPFEEDEERSIFVSNVFKQMEGDERNFAGNQLASRVIELLLPHAQADVLVKFTKELTQDLRVICTDQFGSHVVEKLAILTAFSKLEEREEMLTWLRKLCRFLANNFEDFSSNVYASHLLRTCIQCITGVRPENKEKNRSKQFESKQTAGYDILNKYQFKGDPDLEECLDILNHNVVNLEPSLLQLEQCSAVVQTYLACTSLAAKSTVLKSTLKELLEKIFYSNLEFIEHPALVRLLESILEFSSGHEKMFLKIHKKLFNGRLLELSTHDQGNFAVQRFFENIQTAEMFSLCWAEVASSVEKILASGYTGVVLAVVKSCVKLKCDQAAVLKQLGAALHCDESLEQLAPACIKLMIVERLAEDLPVHLHGSLILQELLKLSKPIQVVRSILSMDAGELRKIFSDPRGSHILDAFLSSSTVGEKSREGLARKLAGELVSLSCSKHGSRAYEALWNSSSLKSKQIMVEELSQQESILRSHQFGKYVYQKCAVSVWKHQKEDWNQIITRSDKDMELFKDILGDSGKEKKKMDIKEKRKSEVKEEENETKKIKLEEPETPTEDENKEKKKKKKKMKSYLDDL